MTKYRNLFATFLLTFSASLYAQNGVYNICDFGALNDTTYLSTTAIQKAIDRCSADGGGIVRVPSGAYNTGSIVLRTGVDLHLDNGATLYGSTDIKDYTPQTTDYISLRTQTPTVQLIYADKASHVSISGNGTIDGRGKVFPKLSLNDEGITRPHLLRFIQCSDICISGITLKNSGCWMQHYLACDRVKIHDITVINRNNYNNDALDLDGCHEVIVSDMIADSDDDGTLAIIIAGSFFVAQKTQAQNLTIRPSGPIIIMPNYDPTDPFTWTRPTPQTKPDRGPQLKTLNNEDGGRKTVALESELRPRNYM